MMGEFLQNRNWLPGSCPCMGSMRKLPVSSTCSSLSAFVMNNRRFLFLPSGHCDAVGGQQGNGHGMYSKLFVGNDNQYLCKILYHGTCRGFCRDQYSCTEWTDFMICICHSTSLNLVSSVCLSFGQHWVKCLLLMQRSTWTLNPPHGQTLDTYSTLGKKIEGPNSSLFHQGLNVISPAGTHFFLRFELNWRLRAHHFYIIFLGRNRGKNRWNIEPRPPPSSC
jgi:hypothetical protein